MKTCEESNEEDQNTKELLMSGIFSVFTDKCFSIPSFL